MLGLGAWSDQQNILELGVSSFDVVRLANHLEDKLKQFINRTSGRMFDGTELVEYLLEQPLVKVAVYVCNAVSDEPNNVLDSNSKLVVNSDDGVEKKNEKGYASGRLSVAQKRAHVGLGDELLPKKLCKIESEMKMVDCSREIRMFRRGQTFINGR